MCCLESLPSWASDSPAEHRSIYILLEVKARRQMINIRGCSCAAQECFLSRLNFCGQVEGPAGLSARGREFCWEFHGGRAEGLAGNNNCWFGGFWVELELCFCYDLPGRLGGLEDSTRVCLWNLRGALPECLWSQADGLMVIRGEWWWRWEFQGPQSKTGPLSRRRLDQDTDSS